MTTRPQVDLEDVRSYDYDLPRELIAQFPLERRSDARMMVIDRSTRAIEHRHVRDLPEILQSGDALVLNDSKVIPARLIGFRTATGGRWEGLYLREDQHGVWEILSKTRGHLAVGETITLRDREGREEEVLRVLARLDSGHLAVRPALEGGTEAILRRFGRVPLPPYIRDGQMIPADEQAYQTVYARQPGSVAAPTAGLHFTTELLNELERRGVARVPVTLHVGLGTFKPVSAQRFAEHRMHREWGCLPAESATRLQEARRSGQRIIAVGTTSARVLESAAQETQTALAPWTGVTDLFIRPGYSFRSMDGLLTNFHLPRSTLLALVCAFAGYELTMQCYREAVEQRYRFFSYGDCMLIL
ncbi:MAG: tRNA preQ1(34) S-adenosylmethionine ribosyltransferase-isomerase QueA [Planctomycetota bacterium]|nr:MAG: tRNA preQ1(34) S-adenosylmethionine ribosyltransferase-isomerase QueA [Planctomycetota bacterium]